MSIEGKYELTVVCEQCSNEQKFVGDDRCECFIQLKKSADWEVLASQYALCIACSQKFTSDEKKKLLDDYIQEIYKTL